MNQERLRALSFVLLIILVFLLLSCLPSRAENKMTCQVHDIQPKERNLIVVCPPSAYYSPLTATFTFHSDTEDIPLFLQDHIVFIRHETDKNYDIIFDHKNYHLVNNGLILSQHLYGK